MHSAAHAPRCLGKPPYLCPAPAHRPPPPDHRRTTAGSRPATVGRCRNFFFFFFKKAGLNWIALEDDFYACNQRCIGLAPNPLLRFAVALGLHHLYDAMGSHFLLLRGVEKEMWVCGKWILMMHMGLLDPYVKNSETSEGCGRRKMHWGWPPFPFCGCLPWPIGGLAHRWMGSGLASMLGRVMNAMCVCGLSITSAVHF